MSDKPVAVIGAGLAGLSAALTLQEAGREVVIYDGSDRVGGRVATDYIDGFTLDRGFQLINAKYPELLQLGVVDELDFIFAPRTIDVCVGEKRIALGDPRSNPFTSLNPATGSLLQKLGLIAYLLRTADAAKSVEEELSHLGNLYSRVLKPFLSGVFLTAPASVNAVIGKGLITSFISGKPGLPRKGVGALPAALATRVHKIELNHRIDSLSQFDNQQVIVATDLTTAAQLLDIANVPKLAGSTTWYYEVPQELTGSARLLIDGEHRGPVVNSIVLSNLISTYAPDGKSLLASTTLDFASESEVRRHLALMWGAHTGEWSLIAKYDIPKSLPIFAIGNQSAASSQFSQNIYVAGDYITAPSQNGALLSGRLAAQELLLDQGR
ncbi:Amine oxidase [Candidatus Planktophila versatilis]|uniref:protoporphyrinogen/coproporphyrinogen oxidase n=1 Tax=Candidatus Planktophila versatilis TaxID=1884905 RepID=UPI003BEF046A